MSRLDSVMKMTPRKGEIIFKRLCVLSFFCHKSNNEYISGTLFVCWLSVHVVDANLNVGII